jgi:acetyltransferase-like isoleucine patch superfamily enzyme
MDIRGRFAYGARCSLGTQSILILPPAARLIFADDVYVGRYVEIGPLKCVAVGDNTSIQDRSIILGDVEIGSHCLFAPNVFVSSGRHYYDHWPALLIKDQDAVVQGDPALWSAHSRPIRIEDDCWIGVNSVIMPGVTIGKGCVIGANSVVVRDVAPYSVAAGNPAQTIKTRLDFNPPRTLRALAESDLPYFYAGFGVARAERLLGKELGGLLVKSQFSLAVNICEGQKVTLVIRSMAGGGTVAIGEQKAQIGSEFTPVTFEPEQDRQGLLSFSVRSALNVKWPACLSGVEVQ